MDIEVGDLHCPSKNFFLFFDANSLERQHSDQAHGKRTGSTIKAIAVVSLRQPEQQFAISHLICRRKYQGLNYFYSQKSFSPSAARPYCTKGGLGVNQPHWIHHYEPVIGFVYCREKRSSMAKQRTIFVILIFHMLKIYFRFSLQFWPLNT